MLSPASSTAEPAPESRGCPTSVQIGTLSTLTESILDLLRAGALLGLTLGGVWLLCSGELILTASHFLNSFDALVAVFKKAAAEKRSVGIILTWGGRS